MTMPSRADLVPRRRIAGLGLASMILIGLVVVLNVVSTWTMWRGYGVVVDYVADAPGVTRTDVIDADDTISTASWSYLLGFVAAAVVFVMWLWRARLNAEEMSSGHHRRSRGWVVGSWICPVVNLWFPFMVVDDVYRASRPNNPPDLYDLRAVPGSRALGTWWALWLGALLLNRIAVHTWDHPSGIGSLRTASVMETVGVLAFAGAGVALVLVMRRIIAWQDGRAAYSRT